MRASRVGLIPAGLYLGFFFANCAYVLYRENYAPENSEFAAFGAVVLTLPWTLLEARFGVEPDASGSTAGALFKLSLYALLNASILHGLVTTLLISLKGKGGIGGIPPGAAQ